MLSQWPSDVLMMFSWVTGSVGKNAVQSAFQPDSIPWASYFSCES